MDGVGVIGEEGKPRIVGGGDGAAKRVTDDHADFKIFVGSSSGLSHFRIAFRNLVDYSVFGKVGDRVSAYESVL